MTNTIRTLISRLDMLMMQRIERFILDYDGDDLLHDIAGRSHEHRGTARSPLGVTLDLICGQER
jgi:hypothetical protein